MSKMKTSYWFCPEQNSSVMYSDGVFYSIKNGVSVEDRYYKKILIGEIYTEDISEEEYNAQLA